MSKSTRIIGSAVPLVVTVVLLALLLRIVRPSTVLTVLADSDASRIFLAIALGGGLSVALAGERWARIVRELGYRLSWKESLRLLLATRPLSLVLPLKAGELAAAHYLARQRGFGFIRIVSTVLLDKYLTLLATVQLCLLGIMLRNGTSTASLLSAGLLILSSSLMLPLGGMLARIFSTYAGKWSPKGGASLEGFADAFRLVPAKRQLFFLGYCHLVQVVHVVTYYLLFQAVRPRVDVPFATLLFAVPAIILILTVPLTLSGFGAREGLVLLF